MTEFSLSSTCISVAFILFLSSLNGIPNGVSLHSKTVKYTRADQGFDTESPQKHPEAGSSPAHSKSAIVRATFKIQW